KFFSAETIELIPGTTSAQAFQAIANGCIRQLLANIPFMDRRNPEALHQMRIALRRMRSAISLFSEVVRDGQVERIKTDLKWLNKELSPARDFDTMFEEVLTPLRRQHPDHHGLKSLAFTFARQRLRSYMQAEKAVHSQRFFRLLIETFAWIEVGEWITTTDETARLRRDWPIEGYAADQLARRRKKIKKKGKELNKLDPSQRHRLRIQVKKTRYATEFFANLFKEKKAARSGAKLLTALKRMQNSLGGLNDVAARKNLCADVLSAHWRPMQSTGC